MRVAISGGGNAARWGCKKCGRGTPEEQERGEVMREGRGCNGKATENIFFEWAPKLNQCPWSFIGDDAWVVAMYWLDYNKYNAFPYAGTLLQQPAFVYQVITLGDNILNELRSRANE